MEKRPKKQFYIVAIVYLVAIACLGFLLYRSYNNAISLIKDQYNTQQLLVAKQTAIGIEGNIKLLTRELEYLSKSPSIKYFKLSEGRKILLENFVFLRDFDVNDIAVLDSKGIIKISMQSPHLEGTDFSYREFFKKTKLLKKPSAVFEFIKFKGFNAEQKGITIAMPIFTTTAEFNGAVIFVIKVNELIKGFVPTEAKDVKPCVIDSSGNILCNPRYLKYENIEQDQGTDLSLKIFLDNVKFHKIFKGEYISADGIKTTAVSHPIRIAEHIWSIIIATPEKTVIKFLTSFSIQYVFVTLIVILAVVSASFVVFYMMNRWGIELDSMVKVRTAELSQSEEKLRGMVETINDLIWEVDADMKYTYVSPIVKKITGYEPDELIGKTIFDSMPTGGARKLKTTLYEIAETEEPFNNLTRVFIHKNGSKIILETNGAPILDDTGNLLGFRCADRDITARKHAENELQKYAVELEEARNNLEKKVEERTKELKKVHKELVRKEKFAVLGELASSVSHELRNPLGVIKNAIYYFNMKMDTIDKKSLRENINTITREINTANKIISSLLDFTRNVIPDRQDVDINLLLKETLSKATIPYNINVITDYAESLPLLSIDPTQIGQVFFNLINNAVQSMETGGTLKVTTTANDKSIEAIILDNGCGIPANNLNKIFEPLVTTKAKGIGLGLAISKSIAEANGAEISAKSVAGEGSKFTVTFTEGF